MKKTYIKPAVAKALPGNLCDYNSGEIGIYGSQITEEPDLAKETDESLGELKDSTMVYNPWSDLPGY